MTRSLVEPGIGVTASRPSRPAILRGWDLTRTISVLALLALVFLVGTPVGSLVMSSLRSTDTGAFTLDNFVIAYWNWNDIVALGNSLIYAVETTVLSAIFAVPLAWGVSRTDMPGKGLIQVLTLGAFITPPYLGAIAWILLAGPNAGWLNRAWMAMTGAEHGLVNVYTFTGMVVTTALYAYPYMFVFTSDALDRVSSEMEEAASILGSSGSRTIFRITLPLVLPAIIGGAIVVFLDTVALFGTPAIIALPARIKVMTLQLWQFFEFPVRAEAAAAYALPLILVTAALFAVQRMVLGRKGYIALTGKGGVRRLTVLGPWRWVMFAYSLLVVGMAVLLPYAALAQAAFSKAWGLGFRWANLTFDNFTALLADPASRETILHSFVYSAASACLAVVLALAAAYLVSRRLGGFTKLLTALCMAPLVIPGIVLAIGFYSAWSPPPLALYGTAAIMILGFTARFLPIAYVNCMAGLRALNPEMEDAVRILGGTRTLAVTRVVVPLLKKSLMGSWLLVFIPAVRELSVAIFLVAAHTRVISMMMLDLSENGSFETLAALGFVLLVATILIVMVGYRLIGRDFMLRRS